MPSWKVKRKKKSALGSQNPFFSGPLGAKVPKNVLSGAKKHARVGLWETKHVKKGPLGSQNKH